MTLAVWHGLAADESSGDLVVLASPSVTVTDRSDGSTPQVYADRDGNTALGNPFTADADGNIEFYVPPGRYKIEATAGGNTVTWDDELIGTLHGIDSPTDGSVPEYDDANDRYTQRAIGTGNDDLPTGSDVLKADPEHATDSATDTYDSATNTTPPADGVVIIRDFQTANGTTTPTLDGKTLTTKDGSALWAGAVSGVHALQRDETADTYLVLEPIPNIPHSTDLLDEDDMASDSDAAVPTQQSVKAYSDSLVADMVDAVTDTDTLTWHETSNQSLGSGSYAVIFDLSSATEIVFGTISGVSIGIRLTVDGTVVFNRTSPADGRDTNGDFVGALSIPMARSASSMKLEVNNTDTISHDYGWRVATR